MQRENRFYQRRRPGGAARLLSIGGILLSLLIVISVSVYAFTARHNLLSKGAVQLSLPSLPVHPQKTCTTPSYSLGDSAGSIISAGVKRTFLVHLAPSYGIQPQPLVILYHGYSWTSQIMEHNSNMDAEADKAGFVLVYPQGLDSPPSWNAGVGADGPTGDADDVQFTRDLLSYLEKNYCVNAHRIYIAGFSLGGGMAYRIACTLTNQIAAVATVSGTYFSIPGGCQPPRPLPVLEIHGLADQLSPYTGISSLDTAGVQDYLNGWLARDHCTDEHDVFFQQGDVTGTEWTHCAANVAVVHYVISDGGHTWPGTPHTTHVIDANVVLWQFFSRYTV
jgi:polyhydroxybutyrate depolymerase